MTIEEGDVGGGSFPTLHSSGSDSVRSSAM